MVGRNKKNFFNEVKLKVVSKISNWQHKFFSSGGKEVLIKAVAQAVLAYAMSFFKLPIGLCDDIQMAMAKFWWRSKEDKCGIHWARWEKMSQAKSKGGLGFREMSRFNQALSDFLRAQAGPNPSYVWRSILWGRHVLQKEIRWSIGNGEQILICRDNWIPRPETFRPLSIQNLPAEATVSEFINAENQWDHKKIIWHFDKKGVYAVKNGYQLAIKMKYPDKPSCSYKSVNHWNRLWTLQLPEKIKIFMWRAGQNLLPTAENLWKKKILVEPHCQVCKQGVESVSHALVHCKAARKVWIHAPFEMHFPAASNQDMWNVMLEITKKMSKSDTEIFVAYCWAIWYGRNHKIFEGKKMDCCQQGQGSGGKHSPMKSQKWCPPPANVFKANVDAAINHEKGIAWLGAVIRDSNSRIIVAAVKTKKFSGDVKVAEAEAVEWGLVVAKNAALSSLIVEIDCQDVAKLINNQEGSKTEIFWVISEIQDQRKDFQHISFHYTPRSCNAHAHSLAKLALRSLSTAVLTAPLPIDVESVFSCLL
ncbi:putative reverse transcriptase/RNA-dependent DNA polymerase [Citrus sinensis]|nr:putative reverse transcriptase/RNA-dependent DNA polymerase [Citrus sinensis]